ncbi:MAG: hypothetical protein NXI18_05475 [Alphaproteobacteria bacterium]|nr:hypothetical protein [Alphaproteobacteria bacterium]
MIDALFASGRIFDIVLAVLLLEAVVLSTLWKLTGRGVPPARILPFLISGAALVAACRAWGLDAPWPVVGGFLTLALCAHAFELYGRWRPDAPHRRLA